jgi:hypothetical protein
MGQIIRQIMQKEIDEKFNTQCNKNVAQNETNNSTHNTKNTAELMLDLLSTGPVSLVINPTSWSVLITNQIGNNYFLSGW